MTKDIMETLKEQFLLLRSDLEYLFYLDKLKYHGTLYLDNDDTFFVFDSDDQDDPKFLLSFDHYLGNSNGLIQLMKALNLTIEEV